MFFQWGAVAGAKHYRYRLVANGKRLLQSRTTETSIHLGAGDPGQTYTARVRVKLKSSISPWASVKATCPEPPAISFAFTVSHIGRERIIVDWSYQNMPAATIEAFIRMRPEVDDTCDSHTESLGRPLVEDNWSSRYNHLCPDTSYEWAFGIVNKSGRIEYLGETLIRTLP